MTVLAQHEQRSSARLSKRLEVKVGRTTGFLDRCVTLDLSQKGMSVAATTVHPIGTRLIVSVEVSPGTRRQINGDVAWSRRGDPTRDIPGVMGLKLVTDDAPFSQLLKPAIA